MSNNTSTTRLRNRLTSVVKHRVELPPLRVEVYDGDVFCRYVDIPDPRADYCSRFNLLAEQENQQYRAMPVDGIGGEKILVRRKEAAELLSISVPTLWKHSQPRGEVPVVYFGDKFIRYSVSALRLWFKTVAVKGGVI